MGEPGTVTWRELWARDRGSGRRTGRSARWLCEVASGADGDEFRAALDEPATERMVHHLDAMLARLRGGEPLQYVLGRWSFRRLDLMVDRRVLIPRPETEQVVERACARPHAADVRATPVRIADLGTGSGAIGLSLAAELPIGRCEVWLTDASDRRARRRPREPRRDRRALGRTCASRAVVVRRAAGRAARTVRPGRLEPAVHRATTTRSSNRSSATGSPAPRCSPVPTGSHACGRSSAGAAQWLLPGGWLVLEIGTDQGDARRRAAPAIRVRRGGDRARSRRTRPHPRSVAGLPERPCPGVSCPASRQPCG